MLCLFLICTRTFFILKICVSGFNEGIVNSKIISFADDTRLYNSVSEVEDCDVLQSDLNTIYKWADANNMAFNKFKYVCFTPSETISHSNIYLCPKINLIDKVENIKDLGITLLVLVLVYTQEGSLWSIVLRCDDHTGIFTCDGFARDPYFYVPAETQSYVIKLSCSRKVLAASGD